MGVQSEMESLMAAIYQPGGPGAVGLIAHRGEVIGMDTHSRRVVVSYDSQQESQPDGSPTRSHGLVPIEDVRLIARAV